MRCVISHTNLGKNLRHLRRQQRMSLEELSEKTDISPAELNLLEITEVIEIDGEFLKRICDFFYTDIESLVEKKIESHHSVILSGGRSP